MDFDPKIKSKAFDETTTYRDDYRRYRNPDRREKYRWPKDRVEPVEAPPKPYHPNDPECFIDWRKTTYIPFNLLIKPRPIIDTHPQDKYYNLAMPPDTEKDKIMKTRPRLYVSPAVSMDDIPDPEMRELLCRYMYTTDWNKAALEAAGPQTPSPPQNTTYEVSCDQVALHTQLLPPVPPSCREHAKKWDIEQRRAGLDPTRTFWIKKDPPMKCGACVNPYKGLVPQEVKKEIADLVQTERLRFVHDRAPPGYAGHKPKLTLVPLPKKDIPVDHPFLSVSQAINKYFAVDKTK